MADISRYIIQCSLHLSGGFFQVSNAYFLVSSWILSQFTYCNLNVVEGLLSQELKGNNWFLWKIEQWALSFNSFWRKTNRGPVQEALTKGSRSKRQLTHSLRRTAYPHQPQVDTLYSTISASTNFTVTEEKWKRSSQLCHALLCSSFALYLSANLRTKVQMWPRS